MPYYTDFYGQWSIPVYIDEMPQQQQQQQHQQQPIESYAVYWSEHLPHQRIECAVYWHEHDSDTVASTATRKAVEPIRAKTNGYKSHNYKTVICKTSAPIINRRKSPLQNGPVPSQYKCSSSSSSSRIYIK